MARLSILFAAAAGMASVYAQNCSLTQKCPEDIPCCSQYGQCGTGAYCLGGCDPRMSFQLDSCVPEPVCVDKKYDFTNGMQGITSNEVYLGNSSATDWVMSGQAVAFDDTVLLTMAANTAGTVLASSTYVWYGNVSATLKTSHLQGVVTAFILLSDVKDEIDFEFVGSYLEVAQSNYYWQAVPDYTHELNISLSDTFNNYHTYTIAWTPDTLTWLVDDQVGRVLHRTDTWNATCNCWNYPQTPARVQLSIWPGGGAGNAEGTVQWAGGPIDWDAPEITGSPGYYYAQVQEVSVTCYNAPSPPGTNTGVSYYYDNSAGTNDTVVNGNNATILKSLLGTGTNMSADYASAAGSSSGSTPTANQNVIPGLTGGGPGTNGQAAGDAQSVAGSGSSPTQGSGSGGSGSQPAAATGTGFSQGSGSSGSGSGAKSEAGALGAERTIRGSIFAVLVAIAGLAYL